MMLLAYIVLGFVLLAYIILGFTLLLANPGSDRSKNSEEVRVPVIDLAPWLEARAKNKDGESKSSFNFNAEQLAIVN